MFTVIRSRHLHLEKMKNAALGYRREWGFCLVYSEKNKLEDNTVVTDVGLTK